MQKPVLFLDFDGPLYPERHIPFSKHISAYPHKLHQWITYWEMDKTSVRQLNSLYDIYEFDTVVSSSWKHYVDREDVIKLFVENGLNLKVHEDWCTPDKFTSYRVNEICWWLDEHTENNVAPQHIILDDPWSGSYLEAWKHHELCEPVLVDPNVGISPEEYKIMKSIVQSWATDHLSRSYDRVPSHMRLYDSFGE